MKEDRVFPAVLLLAATAAYLNGFSGSFQFDDFNVIVDAPAVHSLGGWLADLPTGIRPLLKLTYALNWIASPSPWGFHLVNNLVHAGSSLLVYLLTLELFVRREGEGRLPALAVALLFALHPVRTEAVTYLCGRSVSLASLLMLASLYCHAKGEGSRALRLLWSPLFHLLALGVRETSIVLPLLLLLWDYRAGARLGEAVRRLWVHWAVTLAAAAAWALQGEPVLLFMSGLLEYEGGSLVLRQTGAVFYLLTRWLNPLAQNIDPEVPEATAAPAALGEAALLLLLAGGGLYALMKRRSPAGFGFLWFLLNLAPAYTFLPRYDAASERHLYLAALGLEWASLSLALGLPARARRPAGVFALALLAALGGLTVARNRDYRSETALWEDTVGKSPGKARAHNNLGYAYLAAGRLSEAGESFERALQLDPSMENARKNLEIALKRGKEGRSQKSAASAPATAR